jgi:hypothetical protein
MINDPFKIFISTFKTVYDMKKTIISAFFKMTPISTLKHYIRIWRLEENYNLEIFREYINNKKSSIFKEKSIIFPGYLFDCIFIKMIV